ncbi:MAG TPA: hypothetical protein VHW46_09330 [Terracidiphilus sp.]|jgi:hypothetical protein|nr:hypothetical protein [Terracidiphilus sp.]
MKTILTSISVSLVLALGTLPLASATSLPQPEKLSRQQLQSLIASAKTTAEHERIAHYYEAKAQSDRAQASEHARMATQFRQNELTSSPKWSTGTVNHCDYMAQSLTREATKMQQLAQDHEQMALRAGGR